MAEIKISELPVATTPLTGAELVELSQISGGSYGSVGATTEDIAFAASKYGSFHDLTDQTGSTSAATAVTFNTAGIASRGITLVSNSRITFSQAGVYVVTAMLQLSNSGGSDYTVDIWLAKNGTAVPDTNSVARVATPGSGGKQHFTQSGIITVAEGDYVEIMWLPSNAAVTLDYTAAGAIAPATASAVATAVRIGL